MLMNTSRNSVFSIEFSDSPNRFICEVLAVLYALPGRGAIPLSGTSLEITVNGELTLKFTIFGGNFVFWRESGTTLLGQNFLDQDGLGHLACPGAQDGLGHGRITLNGPRVGLGQKNMKKYKFLEWNSL